MSVKNEIYSDANEKYVKTTLAYADADDGELYFDEKKTTKIPKEDLRNLFLKGMTVVYSGEYLKPVSYKDAGTYGTVTAVHEDSAVAALSFHSAEHGA